jgi:Cof subfamily protein (haloacid dehalogenase superfamily)
MLPQLIAFDLDGTLLPETKVITPRTRAAVRALAAAGTTVTIATGKSLHLSGEYADALGLPMPIIALDGSKVGDWPGGESISSCGVSLAEVAEILRTIDGLALLPFYVDHRDRLVLHEELAPHRAFLSVYARNIDLIADPADALDGEPHFIAFLGLAGDVREGVERLRPITGNGLAMFSADFFRRGVSFLVVRPSTHKGAALKLLAERLGIPRARTAAAGDWKNDVEMLEYAGTAVAMPAADPEVIRAADIVLPDGPEGDGIARWIEELLKDGETVNSKAVKQ